MIKLTRRQKVSHRDFVRFRNRFDSGEYTGCRFGQAFLNTHWTADHPSFPTLYYETDRLVAERLIYSHIIKFDDKD